MVVSQVTILTVNNGDRLTAKPVINYHLDQFLAVVMVDGALIFESIVVDN